MLLFLVSNILGSSVQITTLPLVILSPLQASGLVFNSICATLILSEPFTRYSLVGTVLVCIGAGLIAMFGALKEPAHTLDELLDLLGKRSFLLWMGAQALIIAGILIFTKATQVLYPRAKNTARQKMIRGISYGCVRYVLCRCSSRDVPKLMFIRLVACSRRIACSSLNQRSSYWCGPLSIE